MLLLQHAESENLGTIGDLLMAGGAAFVYVGVFQGQPVPDNVDGSSGLIVMGRPMGVYETDRFPVLPQEMEPIDGFLKVKQPIPGVCLGSQSLTSSNFDRY